MHTLTTARTRLRVARAGLIRLDPHLADRTTWTLFKGPKPGKRHARTRYGMCGTGR